MKEEFYGTPSICTEYLIKTPNGTSPHFRAVRTTTTAKTKSNTIGALPLIQRRTKTPLIPNRMFRRVFQSCKWHKIFICRTICLTYPLELVDILSVQCCPKTVNCVKKVCSHTTANRHCGRRKRVARASHRHRVLDEDEKMR